MSWLLFDLNATLLDPVSGDVEAGLDALHGRFRLAVLVALAGLLT